MTARAVASPVALPRPGSPGAWLLAVRARTLPAAVVPVAVGTAVAHVTGGARWDAALAALLGAVLIQVGTNFANDVFDAEKGADRADRVGEARAVASGLVTARAMRAGMIVAFALATLAGVYLTWIAGPVIVAIGLTSIASGIAYTGGPYPLGYHGLGDLFVLVFFGFVAVCGTVFAQTGEVPPEAWVASVPVGALATNILVVNNVRDRETDGRAGKRTLAVRFGRRACEIEAGVLFLSALVAPAVLAWLRGSAMPLLALGAAPLGVAALRELVTRDGRALDATLGKTARVLLAFGALLTLGLAWS